MGKACSTYGEELRRMKDFCGVVCEKDHLEDPDIDLRIILRWIFRKWDMRAWTGLIGLRTGTGGGRL